VWRRLTPPAGCEEADFRDVVAFGAGRAFVMSVREPAAVFETIDGGVTWIERLREDDPEAFFDSIAFENTLRGVVFGDPLEDGSLYVARTEDGGRTWERVETPPLPVAGPSEAGFAASGTCIAFAGPGRIRIATGGVTSRVLGSDDFGETWFVAEHPLETGVPTSGAYSIAFTDELHGVLVGGDYTRPDERSAGAAWTKDGGRTWLRPQPPGVRGYRSCVTAVPQAGPLTFVATGPNGIDVSLDAGRTWIPFDTFSGQNAIASARDGEALHMVGTNGEVFRWISILPALPDEEIGVEVEGPIGARR
jgi:photosystem II stability/assembly factor-like uncharacterized protein